MMLKKSVSLIVCVCLMFSITVLPSMANDTFSVGDYFQIGQYRVVPVVWRYMGEDDNGKLFLSDKVLCFKGEGGRRWATSAHRYWLNDTGVANETTQWWTVGPYGEQHGFLNEANFTSDERNIMKPVTQLAMLPYLDILQYSANGLTSPYKPYFRESGSPREGYSYAWYSINDLPNIYFGAAEQTTDTVFLLDEVQLYSIWQTFGTIGAARTDESLPDIPNDGALQPYWLRSASKEGESGSIVTTAYGSDGYISPSYKQVGIRPAFYLNELALGDFTGSGTIDDPYILTANTDYVPNESENISVTMDGEAITFDVEPIMANNRVLVPFRAIFEAFGAEVGWDESTSTATATTGDTTITLQIGSNQMQVNDKIVTLDVPAQIVDDRTLVPIRAVSEGLGANVEWDDASKTVIITITK